MADEITIKCSININKNDNVTTFPTKTWNIDMVGDIVMDQIQLVGTSPYVETVDVGDAGAGCWVFAQNLSDTNFVQLGYDESGFVPFIRINPLELAGPFRLDAARTLKVKSDSQACNVRFLVWSA